MKPANDMPFVGLHFVLHAKWARPGNTRHGVNNTDSNIDNYMFYKLHGWIDNVWEKYRLAKGLLPTDQKLKDDLVAHCREMDAEIQIIQNNLEPGDEIPDPNAPLPEESGEFHDDVRPILESQTNLCGGCHAESGANAMLHLGGHISSKDVEDGLVNRPCCFQHADGAGSLLGGWDQPGFPKPRFGNRRQRHPCASNLLFHWQAARSAH